eukprot:7116670-Alexandrium_andersonii.AAC.1
MSASLVGSEMCIRDSFWAPAAQPSHSTSVSSCRSGRPTSQEAPRRSASTCLLYTSDAADDM